MKVSGKFSSYLRPAYRCFGGSWCTKGCGVFTLLCMFLQYFICLIKHVQQQRKYMHCVSWEKQDGWICQGRCPHVSQSAGRILHWHDTQTHIAHNIHQICHLGPFSSWSNNSSSYLSWPRSASRTVFFGSLEIWLHLCDTVVSPSTILIHPNNTSSHHIHAPLPQNRSLLYSHKVQAASKGRPTPLSSQRPSRIIIHVSPFIKHIKFPLQLQVRLC